MNKLSDNEKTSIDLNLTKFKTMRHIETVRNYLNLCIKELLERQESHDQSKFSDEEIPVFEKYTQKLRSCTYGSDEYKQFLKEMEPALKHHYMNNRHHPEFFKKFVCNGCFKEFKNNEPNECDVCGYSQFQEESDIEQMNLIDLLEMIVDWKCSSMRHDDGDLMKSIEINAKRFKYSGSLKQIFINTAKWLESNEAFPSHDPFSVKAVSSEIITSLISSFVSFIEFIMIH